MTLPCPCGGELRPDAAKRRLNCECGFWISDSQVVEDGEVLSSYQAFIAQQRDPNNQLPSHYRRAN